MRRASIALPVDVTDTGVEAFAPERFRCVIRTTSAPLGLGFTRADALENLRSKILLEIMMGDRETPPKDSHKCLPVPSRKSFVCGCGNGYNSALGLGQHRRRRGCLS